jgi:Domain of unknown function (DUF6265)
MRRVAALLALTLIAAGEPGAAPFPDWLAGRWVENKGAKWTEESWVPARGGLMLGNGRSGLDDRLLNWEIMRIDRGLDGTLIFWGSPRGGRGVPFQATLAKKGEIVFTNPAHDYPQRIRYWRVGDVLNAETSLKDGTKPMRWSYRLVK